jgi:hypothetical protein
LIVNGPLLSRSGAGAPARLRVDATASGEPVTLHAGLVLVVTGVRPETSLATSAGAAWTGRDQALMRLFTIQGAAVV